MTRSDDRESTTAGERVGGSGGRAPVSAVDCPSNAMGPAAPALRADRVVSADELEAIHDASLQVLDEIGMDFLDEESAFFSRRPGPGRARPERVRFDRDMVPERIITAPSSFTLHARNPAHHLEIGGDSMAFGSVASAAQRGRPRPRPPRRQPRRLPGPLSAVPDAQQRPFLRWLPGRADRPPRVDPPPRRHSTC